MNVRAAGVMRLEVIVKNRPVEGMDSTPELKALCKPRGIESGQTHNNL